MKHNSVAIIKINLWSIEKKIWKNLEKRKFLRRKEGAKLSPSLKLEFRFFFHSSRFLKQQSKSGTTK